MSGSLGLEWNLNIWYKELRERACTKRSLTTLVKHDVYPSLSPGGLKMFKTLFHKCPYSLSNIQYF